jgi:putative phosphoesterase
MSKLLILSDIHGNWPALQAVIAAEPQYDLAVFCGDVVDYGPFPVECLHWVREHCAHAVRGNHDNALAFGQDCRCMGSFREYSLATRAWHRELLSEADRNYLGSLPTIDWFEWQGMHFRMAHATPQGDLFEYLSPDRWEPLTADLNADIVILGHTHLQDVRRFENVTVVNPGSVGLARDTPGLACYAVYDADQLILKRIPYDVEMTIAALRRAPLTAAVIDGLAHVLQPLTE